MITLLKMNSWIRATRDVCIESNGRRETLPKGWHGWLRAITRENGTSKLIVEGCDAYYGEEEIYCCLDPRDFESALPTEKLGGIMLRPRVCAVRKGRTITAQSRTIASYFPRVTLLKKGDKVSAIGRAIDTNGYFLPKGFVGTIERIGSVCGGIEGWNIPKAVIAIKDALGEVTSYLNPRDFTLVE